MKGDRVGTETAWYVYGVVPADADPASFAATDGVGGGRVELVSAGGLAAIVGRVPLEEYGEEPLRRNLESRDWLETTARAHDDVLAKPSARRRSSHSASAPSTASEDGVREMLEERATDLTERRSNGCAAASSSA